MMRGRYQLEVVHVSDGITQHFRFDRFDQAKKESERYRSRQGFQYFKVAIRDRGRDYSDPAAILYADGPPGK